MKTVEDEAESFGAAYGLTPQTTDALYMLIHQRDKAHAEAPVPMLLWCPKCGERHVDEGEFATKPHHTHACQSCGVVWRPALVPTVGMQFLPGFKNSEAPRG